MNVSIPMTALSDQELIRAYLHGEESAFEFLMRRYLPLIFRFVSRLVQDPALAEDVTQETFIRVWKKASSFHPDRSFKSWLFTIAKHAAFDAMKKKKPMLFSELNTSEGELSFEESLEDERLLISTLLLKAEAKQGLEEAILTLSLPARTIVLLHGIEQLTFQDCAEVLHESIDTVKSRYRRALFTLKQSLESEMHQKGD